MSEHDDSYEPHHESSPTDHVLSELQLYGYRPFADEPDGRPLPEGNHVAGAIADVFDALIVTLEDTRLEPDLDDLLWSTVNVFHRATDRIERELDGFDLGAILFALEPLLTLLIVVQLAFDPIDGAVEHIDGRPEEIVEVGIEAGVGHGGDEGIEDVGDGAFDDAVLRRRAGIGFVLRRTVAVELKLLCDLVGG